MWRIGIVLALLAVFIWGIARVARSRPLFVVRIGPGGVELTGKIPGRSGPDVREFIATLDLPRGAVLRGYPDEEGIRLEFSPEVPRGEHQRLRNFLLPHA